MKYMILVYGSQRDYDSMAGQAAEGTPAWSGAEFAALGAFMEGFANDLVASGAPESAARLTQIPGPAHLRERAEAIDIRPIAESRAELDG